MSTTRTRSKFIGSAAQPWYSYSGWSFPPTTNHEAGAGNGQCSCAYMLDVNDPGFHRKSRSGQVIVNPMTVYKCDARPSRTVWKVKREVWYGYKPYGTTDVPNAVNEGVCSVDQSAFSYGSLPPVSDGLKLHPAPVAATSLPSLFDQVISETGTVNSIATLEANAITRARSNVTAASAALATTIGEAGETLRLLPDSLRLLGDALLLFRGRAIRRTSVDVFRKWMNGLDRDTDKAVRLVGNMWLQYRYGIRPLIYDVRNIATAAIEKLRSPRKTCRGYAYGDYTSNRISRMSFDDASVMLHGITQTSVTTTSRAGILCDVDLELANLYALRFGADRLLVTAWDLVPASFVVDWFLDVSSLLGALSGHVGFTPRGAWVTTETVINQKFALDESFSGRVHDYWSRYYSNYTYHTRMEIVASGIANMRLSRRRRSIVDLTATPSIGLEARLNVSKITDLVALVVGLFR